MGLLSKLFNKIRFGVMNGLIGPILIFLSLFVFLSVGVNKISDVSDQEAYQILKDAILRSVVQCYAIEGMYPPEIEYLEENYGLVYDHERYIIHYEVFASNILPDITIVEKM